MQLTRHTDYALRLLIHLAQHEAAARASGGQARISIAEVAEAQAISRTHLMKIANQLVHAGFVRAARGRSGGLELGRPPAQINLGAVIAETEPHCQLVDCKECRLVRRCGLPGILDEATAAFEAVLAKYSLADFMEPQAGAPRGGAGRLSPVARLAPGQQAI